MYLPQSSLPVPDLDWYQDIVEGAPDTIIIVDRNKSILYHNQQTNGLDRDSLIGRSIFEFFFPEFHQLVRDKIDRVFQTGKEDSYELASDYALKETYWYMTRLGPIIRNGKVIAVSLFIRNITELKRSQYALNQINEDLERRVDLRTRAIKEYANRLVASEKLNEALRQAENRQQVLEILAGQCLNVFEADLTGIYQVEDGQLAYSTIVGDTGLCPAILNPQSEKYLYRLLQSNKTRCVQMLHGIEPVCQMCSIVHEQKMQTLLTAPLRLGDTVMGVLFVGFKTAREFSSDDEQILNAFVESGSNTLHRIRVTEELERTVRQREHELHVLYEIMSIASEIQEEESLLKRSLATTLQAVNCCTGVIHLTEANSPRLKIAADENYPVELDTFLQLRGYSADLWTKVYQGNSVVEVRDLPTQSYTETTGPEVQQLSYLGVPIHSREKIVGVLSLFCEDERILEPGVRQLVSTIADQIGLALEATHKRQRDREALILEERQRLARDLHDSVSQGLYGLVLSADVGRKLIKLKAYAQLSDTLTDIGEAAIQSLKEMRLMLFELRPLAFDSYGLVGALDLRLNTVERRAGMQTSLEYTGEEYYPRHLDLEIYRIATEALNNSLKHAHASMVRVTLNATQEQFELTIEDDGKGFDSSQKHTGGIGLSSMKERSSRIGGTITIDTTPEFGTRVKLVVPLHKFPFSMREMA